MKVNYVPGCGGICWQKIGEHGGEGVLGASTYDAKRGAEWIKAHITLKRLLK
jgi:hypothetical protein